MVGFIGPEDFFIRNVKAETARVAYALPLSQESFATVQIRIAALQIRVEVRVLQGNRGLRRQHFEHRNLVRREGTWRQIILQVERADELRLIKNRKAQNRPGA